MSVDAGLAFIDFALAREVIGFAWKGARSFALLSTYLIMYLKYLCLFGSNAYSATLIV